MAAKDVAAKRGKPTPFVAHVHATETDRSGAMGNPGIVAIEKNGLQAADRVVAVSNYTKRMVHEQYEIPLDKISVVHNGIPAQKTPAHFDFPALKKKFKIVLFMGRLTMQKGPDYFIKLAKAVTDQDPTVKFVMVGSGDMENAASKQPPPAALPARSYSARSCAAKT